MHYVDRQPCSGWFLCAKFCHFSRQKFVLNFSACDLTHDMRRRQTFSTSIQSRGATSNAFLLKVKFIKHFHPINCKLQLISINPSAWHSNRFNCFDSRRFEFLALTHFDHMILVSSWQRVSFSSVWGKSVEEISTNPRRFDWTTEIH